MMKSFGHSSITTKPQPTFSAYGSVLEIDIENVSIIDSTRAGTFLFFSRFVSKTVKGNTNYQVKKIEKLFFNTFSIDTNITKGIRVKKI